MLQVLAGEFHRTGVEESSVGAVFRELAARLRTEAMPVLSLPGFKINYIACMERARESCVLKTMFHRN